MNSITDILSKSLSPVIRKLSNISIELSGTQCSVLRISESKDNVFGDKTSSFQSEVIDNCVIKFPNNTIRTGESYGGDGEVGSGAENLFELLPIYLYTKFKTRDEENNDSISINLKIGDIIVYILLNEYGEKFPINLSITRIDSIRFGHNIVAKRLTLARQTGLLENDIKNIVTTYINDFKELK